MNRRRRAIKRWFMRFALLKLADRGSLMRYQYEEQSLAETRHQSRDPRAASAVLPPEAGGVWEDNERGHRVACIDSADTSQVHSLVGDKRASLALHDPPYNLVAFQARNVEEFTRWCRAWVAITHECLADDASLYVWLRADQNEGFQPLADFMVMMRQLPFQARSFITMRNQRGYGTQKNWMAVRQELLYYVKGRPDFNVEAEYTDIPKILRGYYKEVNGEITENLERSRSETIRAGNVWVDVQAEPVSIHLREIGSPRGFGEAWAQGHLKERECRCWQWLFSA